jgi:ABC-type antimicrobial peptide transport system permease subunit
MSDECEISESGCATLMTLLGAIITSICVGYIYGAIFGWLLFGGVLIFYGGVCLLYYMVSGLISAVKEDQNDPKDKEN